MNLKQNKHKKSTFEHTIITVLIKTDQEKKILRIAREKGHLTNKEKNMHVTEDFSSDTMEVTWNWHNVYKYYYGVGRKKIPKGMIQGFTDFIH